MNGSGSSSQTEQMVTPVSSGVCLATPPSEKILPLADHAAKHILPPIVPTLKGNVFFTPGLEDTAQDSDINSDFLVQVTRNPNPDTDIDNVPGSADFLETVPTPSLRRVHFAIEPTIRYKSEEVEDTNGQHLGGSETAMRRMAFAHASGLADVLETQPDTNGQHLGGSETAMRRMAFAHANWGRCDESFDELNPTSSQPPEATAVLLCPPELTLLD